MTLVTPLVKPVRPPITLDEKLDTLPTTEAAKADPGMVGMENDLPPPVESEGGVTLVAGTVPETIGLEKVGS